MAPDLSTLTDDDLIQRFEADMVYDCHGYTTRFERSLARRELVRRGLDALPLITRHLKAHPPGDFRDLSTGWGQLLNQIENEIDPEKSGPKLLKDTAGWITWADKMTDPIHLLSMAFRHPSNADAV